MIAHDLEWELSTCRLCATVTRRIKCGNRGSALCRERRSRIKRERGSQRHDPALIFERDGYICQLCGQPTLPDAPSIQKGRRVAHPLSPSVDHIVPMARGGRHRLSNLQCAHLRCNVAKQDALEVRNGEPPKPARPQGQVGGVLRGRPVAASVGAPLRATYVALRLFD